MKKRTVNSFCIMVLIVTMLAMSLAGCRGSNTEQSAAVEAAEGVLAALQEGDMDAITEYASEDILMNGDLSGLRGMTEFTADMLGSLGVERETISDEAVSSIDKLGEALMSGFVKSYTIDEAKENDGVWEIPCTVTFGYDVDSLDESEMSTKVSELVQKYSEENIDELVKVLQDEGEDALLQKIVSACMPSICQMISEFVAASGEKTASFIMKVENLDGKWMVTEAKAAE